MEYFYLSKQFIKRLRGGGLSLLIGILSILWGVVILFNTIFKLPKENFKEKFHFISAGDGSIQSDLWEILFSLISFFPWWFVKGFVIIVGIAFVFLGIKLI